MQHAYILTNIRNHLHINTYIQCKQNPNICIYTKSNANKYDAVRICGSLLRSMFHPQKQKHTLHAGKRFIFGRDKHTKPRTYSYIHAYSHRDLVFTLFCKMYPKLYLFLPFPTKVAITGLKHRYIVLIYAI